MSSKHNIARRKKRKFYGIRYTAMKTSPTVEPEPQETAPVWRSSSAVKLGEQVSERPTTDDPPQWLPNVWHCSTDTVHSEVSVPYLGYLPAWRLWRDRGESRTC